MPLHQVLCRTGAQRRHAQMGLIVHMPHLLGSVDRSQLLLAHFDLGKLVLDLQLGLPN